MSLCTPKTRIGEDTSGARPLTSSGKCGGWFTGGGCDLEWEAVCGGVEVD